MTEPVYIAGQTLPTSVSLGVRPVTPPVLPNTIGEHVAQLGTAGTGAFERLEAAQILSREINTKAQYLVRVNALAQKYAQDPDYATAPARFAADRAQLESDLAKGANLDATRGAQLNFFFAHAGLTAEAHVARAALVQQNRATRESLDGAETANVTIAAQAPTPAQRQEAVANHADLLASAAQAGWIGAAEAKARAARFGSRLDAADAATVISHDPELASTLLDDPDAFANLNPAQRVALSFAAIDAANARERAQSSDAVEGEGLTLARNDKLTPDWLAANEGMLSNTAKARLGAMAMPHPPAGDPDPRVYADLLARATDDRAAVPDAADAYLSGHIGKAEFASVHDTAARFDRDIEARPWAIDNRRDIVEALKPTPRQSPASAMSQLGALDAYDKWLDTTPDATAAQSQQQANALITQYRGAAADADRHALPLPRFVAQGRDDLDMNGLVAGARGLRDAHDRGDVDNPTYEGQVDLLQRWQDVLQRQGGGD